MSFKEFSDKHIVFSFPAIQWNPETQKKRLVAVRNFQKLEKSKVYDYHKSLALLTGKKSGVTVIDFDDSVVYDRIVAEHPEVETFAHVLTKKGRHIYFEYNGEPLYNQTVGWAPNVDIRNDGGFVIAPGTKYLAGETLVEYKWVDGVFGPIPDWFAGYRDTQVVSKVRVTKKSKCKLVAEHAETEVPCEASETCEKKKTKKQIKDEEKAEAARAGRFRVIKRWFKAGYFDTLADNRTDWIIVSAAINECADTDGEAFDLFTEFSKISDKYNPTDAQVAWDSFSATHEPKSNAASLFKFLKRRGIIKSIKTKGIECVFEDITPFFNNEVDLYDLCIYFNDCWFPVLNGGKMRYATYTDSGDYSIDKMQPLTGEHLNLNYFQDDVLVSEPIYKLYISCMDRGLVNTKNHIRFVPYPPGKVWNKRKELDVNLFDGWQCELLEEVDNNTIEPVLTHIFKAFCRGDITAFEYILDWLSFKIQKPDEKNYVALIFVSEKQGVGKNLVWDEFIGKKIFGKTYQLVVDVERCFAKFNSSNEKSLLVVLDELSTTGAQKKNNDRMKSMLTSTTQDIEPKGLEMYNAIDYRSFVMLSNNADIVKIENSDRRYCMLECDLVCDYNEEYWTRFIDILNDPVTQNNFFTFLARRDISKFKFTKLPTTALKEYNRALSEPPIKAFLRFLYEEGNLSMTVGTNTSSLFNKRLEFGTDIIVQSTKMYEGFAYWAKTYNSSKYIDKHRKFAMEMKNMGLESIKGRKYNVFKISKDSIAHALGIEIDESDRNEVVEDIECDSETDADIIESDEL